MKNASKLEPGPTQVLFLKKAFFLSRSRHNVLWNLQFKIQMRGQKTLNLNNHQLWLGKDVQQKLGENISVIYYPSTCYFWRNRFLFQEFFMYQAFLPSQISLNLFWLQLLSLLDVPELLFRLVSYNLKNELGLHLKTWSWDSK